jgi:lipoprotein-releasing system ATP-binding protein
VSALPDSTSRRSTGPESSGQPDVETASVLVEVRDMSKTFQHGARKLDVLRGVNLTLREGEMVTIIGASGAGKSTLLHCLGTLDLPTSGEILVWPRAAAGASPGASRGAPTDITRLSPPDLAEFRNRSIGFVFQFHHLLPEFSAVENVMMPALIARMPVREARERAEHILDQVAMSHRLAHRPGELSGGEQQRVAIARALVMQPRLLLADEPTGNLDTRTSAEVHGLLFQLNAEHALSMLVVTHNMQLAEQMPRVVRMADGRILEGAGDELPYRASEPSVE